MSICFARKEGAFVYLKEENIAKDKNEELVTYCETNYVECETDCIFTRKRCVQEINRRLKEARVELHYKGKVVQFDPLIPTIMLY